MDKFTGKLELDWISVDDRMPLDEFEISSIGLVAEIFVLIVDFDDINYDSDVVNLQYDVSGNRTKAKWITHSGKPYPEPHASNIRYWCYVPHYRTRQIMEFEKND